MTYYETTKKEIATIAPRTFKLNLSDADVVRIFEKAGAEDLTEDKECYTLLNENTRKEITDIFEHYCNSNKQHKSFDEEIGTVREYREKLKRVLGEKSDDTDNRNINRN